MFLRKQFTTWYSKKVSQQVQDDNEIVQPTPQVQKYKSKKHTSKKILRAAVKKVRSDSSDDVSTDNF